MHYVWPRGMGRVWAYVYIGAGHELNPETTCIGIGRLPIQYLADRYYKHGGLLRAEYVCVCGSAPQNGVQSTSVPPSVYVDAGVVCAGEYRSDMGERMPYSSAAELQQLLAKFSRTTTIFPDLDPDV